MMKNLVATYILCMVGALLVSCKDDFALKGPEGQIEEDFQNLSVLIDIPAERTRAIDMTPGAPVYIQKVWIGIYDRATGERVGGTPIGEKLDFHNRLTPAGIEIPHLIPVKFYENFVNNNINNNDKKSQDLCVVGVANYEPSDADNTNLNYIYTFTKTGELPDDYKLVNADDNGYISLYDALNAADTWSKFIDIAINTESKGFVNQTPMLMGYFYKKSEVPTEDKAIPNFTYTKVNQFATGDGVNVICSTNLKEDQGSPIWIKANGTGVDAKLDQSSDYQMRFRRLRSKMNVVFDENSKYELIGVQYKVHNKPTSVFLAQRRTIDYTQASDIKYSPNHADLRWNNPDEKENAFLSDDDWVTPDNIKEFSFEHFENKHWALDNESIGSDDTRDDQRYHDREAHDIKSSAIYFKALATSAEDWNNNAAYFELKMNIRDVATGQNAEVTYLIHEGFCNDQFGNETTDLETRLKDFACIRNTNYTYKITIKGVSDISLQVIKDNPHTTDQQGKIWNINYLKETVETHKDQVDEDIIKDLDSPLAFLNDEGEYIEADDIAFRLLGTVYNSDTDEDMPVDICYNFAKGDLDKFVGLWPAPQNEYTEYVVTQRNSQGEIASAHEELEALLNGNTNNSKNFLQFLDKIKINVDNEYLDVTKFIHRIDEEEESEDKINPEIKGFKFQGYQLYDTKPTTETGRERDMRALYIFDREKAFEGGSRIATDKWFHTTKPNETCTFIYEINGIRQEPLYLDNYDYQMVKVKKSEDEDFFDNEFDGDVTDFNNLQGGTGILLSSNPDIAFRLTGWTHEKDDNDEDTYIYHDYCYSFSPEDYAYYLDNNEWPNFDDATIIKKGELNNIDIPTSLLNSVKIKVGNEDPTTITNFALKYNGSRTLTEKNIGFTLNSYEIEGTFTDNTPVYYGRTLYVFDKKNRYKKPVIYRETDGNLNATHQIYAIHQEPIDKTEKVTFTVNALGNKYTMSKWISEYYNKLTDLQKNNINYKIHYTTGSANWTGTVNSIVYMPLTMTVADWIKEYKFDFINGNKKITRNFTLQQIRDMVNSSPDDFIILEEHTDGEWTPGIYDVVITPIANNEGNGYSGYSPVTLKNQLDLTAQSWDFGTAPWSLLDYNDFDISGWDTRNTTYSSDRNFFFNYYGMEMGVYSVRTTHFVKSNGYIPTFNDIHPAKDNVLNGPTDGHPFQFKFKTLKSGTLYLYVTCTSAKEEERSVYVKVGNNERRIYGFPASGSKPTKASMDGDKYAPVEITADGINGTEVIIFTPSAPNVTEGNGINGTVRIYGFEFEPK